MIIIIKTLALLKIGRYSAKEFLYWTTQNWAAGTIIALSPSANQIKFTRPYGVVDNLYDNFYDYTLQTSNGQTMGEEFRTFD